MTKTRKISFAISVILFVGLFVSTCVCVYLFNWNYVAYWWSWAGILVVSDIVLAIVLYLGKYRTDETKAFWLFILLVIPFFGAIAVLCFGLKYHTEKGGISHNQATLLHALFSAKESIKIYTDSMFVTMETFRAINYARFKGIKLQILVSKQPKKERHNLMLYNFNRFLDREIPISIIDKKLSPSFIVIDDNYVLEAENNFNFKNIYSDQKIKETNIVNSYLKLFNDELANANSFKIDNTTPKLHIRIKYGSKNIFYLFY